MEYIKFGAENNNDITVQKQNIPTQIKYKNRANQLKPKTEAISIPEATMESTHERQQCDDQYLNIKTQNSPLLKMLCAVMTSVLLFMGVYLSKIQPPKYIESAVMTLIEKSEDVINVQKYTDNEAKIIGGKILVDKPEDNYKNESEIKTQDLKLNENINAENESFAETIKLQSEENNKIQGSESIQVNEKTDTGEAIQVIAKNLSKGSDKLYFSNKTDLDIDINNFLSLKYPINKPSESEKDSPKVLIIHTHGTEAYIDTSDRENARSSDINKNVVRVGEELAKVLRSYGISVIHSETMHDEISYVNSYASSKKEAINYLEKYPSIEYIIDVHRDALGTEESPVKTYTEINGTKTAQLMLVMGTNAAGGNHPNFKENLTVASYIQQKTNDLYPTLMRPMSIRPIIFNQNLTIGSMILEVGSDANSLEEAIAAVRMFGRSFAECVYRK